MSSNKTIRKTMEQKYGKKCMMEAAGIRCISMHKRKKIKGYKRTDEMITYHHIKPLAKGGETTVENGALLKSYNHQWLERQPQYVKDKINKKLQQYKTRFVGLEITGDGRIGNQVMMDLEEPGEFIEIPLIPNKEEEINPEDVIRARYEEQWEK